MVGILCEMDQEYAEYVVKEGYQNVLYVHITMAMYGLSIFFFLTTIALFSRRDRMSCECMSLRTWES
jgi:hypothetical protein